MNKRNTKAFLTTMFIKQNKYHNHSVIGHTIKVVFELIKMQRYDLVAAGFLHDIAKPLSAYQDEGDILTGEYSFTNHEIFGYHMIKNWPTWLVSDYSKNIVRHHYLIRGLHKSKKKNNIPKYKRLKRIWDKLDNNFKVDLSVFMTADDLGKKAWFQKELRC